METKQYSETRNRGIILSPRDLEVVLYEPSHRYGVGDKFATRSVSSLTSIFFDGFDADSIIQKKISKESYNTNDDAAFLKASWSLTASIGTGVHKLFENFFNKEENDWNSEPLILPKTFEKFYEPNVECTHIFTQEHFSRALNERYDNFIRYKIFFEAMEFVASEYIIYGKVAGELIAGTIDALFKKDDVYYIIDWKTTDNLINGFSSIINKDSIFKGKKMTKFDKYKCQLHCYQYILEKYYGVTIGFMAIVQTSNPQFNILSVEKDCLCKEYYKSKENE